jgi:hypothetical protein
MRASSVHNSQVKIFVLSRTLTNQRGLRFEQSRVLEQRSGIRIVSKVEKTLDCVSDRAEARDDGSGVENYREGGERDLKPNQWTGSETLGVEQKSNLESRCWHVVISMITRMRRI